MKRFSYLAGTVALALTVALSGCGKTPEPNQPAGSEQQESADESSTDAANEKDGTDSKTNKNDSDKSSKSSTDSNSAKTGKLESKVKMTNIQMESIEVWSASLDNYEPESGYVISATVKNGNDVSCDITPSFFVTIGYENEYGDPKSERIRLFETSPIYTPYGMESMTSTNLSVGLAPGETKEVRFYINLANGPIVGNPYDLDADIRSARDDKHYDVTSLSDIELESVRVEKSDYVYLPTSEWDGGVSVEKVDRSQPGLTSFAHEITGSISNQTSDRWKQAFVQYDVAVNGQTMNAPALRKASYSYDHVDRGDVLSLEEGEGAALDPAIAAGPTDQFDIGVTPALLAYLPDTEE